MERGLYINGKLHYRSSDFGECATNAIDFLHEEWVNHKGDNSSSQIEYLRAVREIMIIKDDVSHATYNGNILVIKPIEEKKYLVRYTVEFEEDVDLTDEDWISKEFKYICNADKVRKIYTRLRDCLEIEIQKGFKSFDEMLGDEVECLQDTDEVYEVYDKLKRAFHCITITQIK